MNSCRVSSVYDHPSNYWVATATHAGPSACNVTYEQTPNAEKKTRTPHCHLFKDTEVDHVWPGRRSDHTQSGRAKRALAALVRSGILTCRSCDGFGPTERPRGARDWGGQCVVGGSGDLAWNQLSCGQVSRVDRKGRSTLAGWTAFEKCQPSLLIVPIMFLCSYVSPMV